MVDGHNMDVDERSSAWEGLGAVDRDLQLPWQALYAQFHTVDEVRAKYYQSAPMRGGWGMGMGDGG